MRKVLEALHKLGYLPDENAETGGICYGLSETVRVANRAKLLPYLDRAIDYLTDIATDNDINNLPIFIAHARKAYPQLQHKPQHLLTEQDKQQIMFYYLEVFFFLISAYHLPYDFYSFLNINPPPNNQKLTAPKTNAIIDAPIPHDRYRLYIIVDETRTDLLHLNQALKAIETSKQNVDIIFSRANSTINHSINVAYRENEWQLTDDNYRLHSTPHARIDLTDIISYIISDFIISADNLAPAFQFAVYTDDDAPHLYTTLDRICDRSLQQMLLNPYHVNLSEALFLASEANKEKIVKKMVQAKIRMGNYVSLTHPEVNHPIVNATYDNFVGSVKSLLKLETDPQNISKPAHDALTVAVRRYNQPIIRLFIDRGVRLDYIYEDGETLLHVAARGDDIDCVRMLLQHNVDPNIQSPDLYFPTAFMQAIANQRLDIAILLAQYGADIHTKNSRKETALAYAVFNRDTKSIRYLLENGVDPNQTDSYGIPLLFFSYAYIARLLRSYGARLVQTDSDGRDLLYLAVRENKRALIKELLVYGLDTNAKTIFTSETTMLVAAIAHDNLKAATALIEHGANIHAESSNEHPTALIQAILQGDPHFVKYLLERGANPNQRNKDGKPLLFIAFEKNAIEIFDLLINHGADLYQTDSDRKTLLHAAILQGNLHWVKRLLDRGFDPNNTNHQLTLSTPLMWAVLNQRLDIATLLVERGANIYAVNLAGQTALTFAVLKNNIPAVKYLLDRGVNPHSLDQQGNSLLVVAFDNNAIDTIPLLLERDINLNQTSGDGRTLLYAAVAQGDTSLVKKLLNFGLDPNTQLNPPHSPTVLWLAVVEKGNKKNIKSLLDHGADPNVYNKEGMSLLFYAIQQEDLELVRLLLKAGAKIEIRDPRYPPLHYACLLGCLEIVKLLVNTDHKCLYALVGSDGGHTPLCPAVKKGHIEIVRYLLSVAPIHLLDPHRRASTLTQDKDILKLLQGLNNDAQGSSSFADSRPSLFAPLRQPPLPELIVAEEDAAEENSESETHPLASSHDQDKPPKPEPLSYLREELKKAGLQFYFWFDGQRKKAKQLITGCLSNGVQKTDDFGPR